MMGSRFIVLNGAGHLMAATGCCCKSVLGNRMTMGRRAEEIMTCALTVGAGRSRALHTTVSAWKESGKKNNKGFGSFVSKFFGSKDKDGKEGVVVDGAEAAEKEGTALTNEEIIEFGESFLTNKPPLNERVEHLLKFDASSVPDRLKAVVAEVASVKESEYKNVDLSDLKMKAKIVISCEEEFEREIPSFALNVINSVADLEEFLLSEPYINPSDYPLFHRVDFESLPPNLLIEKEPVLDNIPKPFKSRTEIKQHFISLNYEKNSLKSNRKKYRERA
eukprot:Nk52_evm11s238 gene=Nk52_evmTU11s238